MNKAKFKLLHKFIMQHGFSKIAFVIFLFAVIAFASLVLTIVGCVYFYSPIPFNDMWGSVEVFSRAQSLSLSEWWAQHNEHRILLARCLFWLDFHLFNGSAVFLLLMNYVLLFLIFLTLEKFFVARLSESKDSFTHIILSLVVSTMLFSWIQNENLVWTFQSQFFLAYLLPLVGFYLLYLAASGTKDGAKNFSMACVSGVTALGSMANGVLALPLMAIMAMLLKMGWQRVAMLIFLSIVGTVLYFYDYHAPKDHGHFLVTLLNQPIEFFQYVLLYLGGPFYWITGKTNFLFGQFAGFFLVGSFVCFSVAALKRLQDSKLVVALLMFLAYVFAAALATAGGRLFLGMEFATSSRYMTPTLMAWAILLILYAPMMDRYLNKFSWKFLLPLFALQVMFLVSQFEVLAGNDAINFERKIAALALELDVNNSQQLTQIFPDAPSLQSMARPAIEHDLSVFGDSQFRNARHWLYQPETTQANKACIGGLDGYRRTEDPRYVQIEGWLFDSMERSAPETIHIVDSQGVIIGYAITGKVRQDLKPIATNAVSSGFKGYLLAEYIGRNVLLVGVETNCKLDFTVSLSAVDQYEQSLADLARKLNIQDKQQIEKGNFELRPTLFERDNRYTSHWSEITPLLGNDKVFAKFENTCSAVINEFTEIIDDSQHVRFIGSLTFPAKEFFPEIIRVLDERQNLVGYGITLPRQNIADQTITDFRGYLLSAVMSQPLNLQSLQSNSGCYVALDLLPFKVVKPFANQKRKLLDSSSILQNNQWLGTDKQNTQREGYHIWGSYVHSGEDTGEITLKMQRGSAFFYRSGTQGGKQLLIFNADASEPIVLPVANDWVEMQFTGFQLPKEFTVKLIDQGTEAGEWSAIGLKN